MSTRGTTRGIGGHRALIIGGGSGIGLATARLLASDGALVTIAGRTVDKLVSAREQLAADGLEVGVIGCDACDGDQVKAAVERAGPDGRLDIAVVVPGGGTIRPVLQFGDDQFSKEVDLNIRPIYLTLKYAGRAMLRNGGGSFVAVSSTAGKFSVRSMASYSAGKAGVDHLVRVAADELGRYNIRVNSIQPGLTRTSASAAMFEDLKVVAAFMAQQPLARPGEAADIANAIRFMAGPESSWVTGQVLTVDGGHTLRAFVDFADLLSLPGNDHVSAPGAQSRQEQR